MRFPAPFGAPLPRRVALVLLAAVALAVAWKRPPAPDVARVHPAAPSAVAAAKAAPTPARAVASRPAPQPAALPVGGAGMRVALDPETGELGMPTPEQAAALELPAEWALNHSDEGLVLVRHPNGMLSLDLQGRFQEFTVATIGPDGKPVLRCGPDPARLLGAPAAPPAAPAAAEVK